MSYRPAGKVIFIRHGQSVWNVKDAKKGHNIRFTGWANVELTDHGREQAAAVGRCLKMFGLYPHAVYTSLLRRARDSLDEMIKHNPDMFKVPIVSTWRLNERHYGALVGMSKDEASRKLGYDLVMGWRRSWDLAPPPLSREDEYYWRDAPWAKPMTMISSPHKQTITAYEKDAVIPTTESLEDCAKRVKPIWVQGIAPRVARGETVLVVAHANSIRSMIRHIDSETMTDEKVRDINIPSSTPLVYSFKLVDQGGLGGAAQGGNNIARSLKPMGEPSRLGMTGRYLATKEIIRLALQSSVTADEDLGGGGGGKGTSFFDLIEKGLTEIYDYSDQNSEAIVVTDGRGVIIQANQAWEQLCGYTFESIRGKTNKFLQGELTNSKEIFKLDEKLRTGLPVQGRVINYRGSGVAFENVFTIIPVYDWLEDRVDSLQNKRGRQIDYAGGDYDSFQYRRYSEKFMHPSHFVARLEPTPDRYDLPGRREEKKEELPPPDYMI